jgi:hypothetical protein
MSIPRVPLVLLISQTRADFVLDNEFSYQCHTVWKIVFSLEELLN